MSTTESQWSLKIGVRPLLSWLKDLMRSILRKQGAYLFLRPSFCSKQIVYSRRTKTYREFQIRDRIDLMVGYQIYRSEDYNLDRLARKSELQQYYRGLVESGERPLIVDCGANIGLSAKYFSEHYPEAKVVAIEPESANFNLLKINCPEPNIEAKRAGIASEKGRGKIVDPGEGNWGFRTEAGAGDIEMVSVNSLLESATGCSPFLIKIDIEGFEEDLFARNTEWVDRFPILIIELHDWMLPKRGASQNFLRVVSQSKRDFIYIGENVFSLKNR